MGTLVLRYVLLVNRSSRCLFWFRFTGKHCFTPGSIDFLIPAHFWCRDSVREGSFLGLVWARRLPPRHSWFTSGFAFYQCGIMALG